METSFKSLRTMTGQDGIDLAPRSRKVSDSAVGEITDKVITIETKKWSKNWLRYSREHMIP